MGIRRSKNKVKVEFTSVIAIMGVDKFLIQVETPQGDYSTITSDPVRKITPTSAELMELARQGEYDTVITHINKILRNHYLEYVYDEEE